MMMGYSPFSCKVSRLDYLVKFYLLLSRTDYVRLCELADVLGIVDVLDAFCDCLVLVK